jgi:RNA polymerase sigma factor (TIGR02999 family)
LEISPSNAEIFSEGWQFAAMLSILNPRGRGRGCDQCAAVQSDRGGCLDTEDRRQPESRIDGDPTEITAVLARCSGGDREAFESLVPLVYDDLRRIAHRRLQSERTDITLDTTAVVHEAYLALVDQATATWNDRAHFFAVAARVIRHVLIDHARRRGALKRGGGELRVPLKDDLVPAEGIQQVDLVALDHALAELGRHDPRLERVVECRFFGGMTVPETAAALDTSVRTVERDWTRARAYLYQALS